MSKLSISIHTKNGFWINPDFVDVCEKILFVTLSGKRNISAQKLKIELLASKESEKLVLSNDTIVALVAAFVFAP